MKKLFILLALCSTTAMADTYAVQLSSYIFGGTQQGCIAGTSGGPVFLDKVLIPTATASGNLMIFNSSWTIVAPVISSMSLATVQMYDFNNTKTSGICYRAAAPTNGVTITYHK